MQNEGRTILKHSLMVRNIHHLPTPYSFRILKSSQNLCKEASSESLAIRLEPAGKKWHVTVPSKYQHEAALQR